MSRHTTKPIPVRYFAYTYGEHDELDTTEVSRDEFEALVANENRERAYLNAGDNLVTYERHSTFNNGVDQVCLTVDAMTDPVMGSFDANGDTI